MTGDDEDADGEVLIRTLLEQTADALGNRHEARWVCEVATSLDGDELDRALDEPATVKMVRHLDEMVARIRTGEPLQYVLGRWAFRTLDLAIDRRVLIPRPETELVTEVAIELARRRTTRLVADLGTGSGAIGLAMAAELPVDGTTVWLTDVDDGALAVASANLAGLGRPASNVRIAAGSWFDALPPGVRFDVIVSNPPYVADGSPLIDESVTAWEPHGALFAGPDGLNDIRMLIDGARDRLVDGGALVMEIGSDQGPSVRSLLVESGYVDVDIRADLAGHDRIAVAVMPADPPQR